METGMLFILLSMFLCFAHTERQFVFVDTPMDWTSAQTYCRQKYTDLVTVYDDQENQELTELAPNTNMNIWIGLRHKVNKWRWSMGDPPLSDNKYETIWAVTQPDNRQGKQHCVTVSVATNVGDGVFDRDCVNPYSFICFDASATEKFILINTQRHGCKPRSTAGQTMMTWPL
ncbi:hypothetical protein NQD34_008265 [Periophthalmus magnuspinnatus]|nr:hypothetical protein NQD34_008265 [Periophthalmus magnuspinnatus]